MRNTRLRPLGLALAAAVCLAAAAEATTLKETFNQTYPLSAGGSFVLRNVNGAVNLEAWDRNEVRVEADKEVKAGSDDEAKRLMSEVKIDVQASHGTVRVDTRLPKRGESGLFDWLSGHNTNVSVTYRVHVPRSVAVDAGNTNGHIALTGTHGKATLETTNGHVEVAGVDGDIKIETTNGHIKVADSAGTVHAETTNGHIDVSLSRVPSAADLSLDSTNGGITVRLPKDVRASVDAATSNGSVHSDFEVAGAGGEGKHRRTHLEGDIHGGGGKLRIRTTNGSVHILQG